MPLTKRIIPCLDVDQGKVVKGINFLKIRRAGDPVELAKRYCEDGADELVFLDITASSERREILSDIVRSVALEINIPFTVGGGIRNTIDARKILCKGADKISINTAAIEKPSIIKDLAKTFGQQCVVVAIDIKRNNRIDEKKNAFKLHEIQPFWFEVYSYGGRKKTGLDAVQWAKKAEELGAGELLVTSMDRDGTKKGYDLELNRIISENVNIPIIASGGAGNAEHFLDAFTIGKADAALAASVFHYKKFPIPVVKKFLKQMGVLIRL